VIDADVADLCLRAGDFGFAGLEISGEVRKERAGDLHAIVLARVKHVACQHAIWNERIDFGGSEKFRLERAGSWHGDVQAAPGGNVPGYARFSGRLILLRGGREQSNRPDEG